MNSDICIITEGTYPYVVGGVSTWIAQIIESMPDLKFSVLNISASRQTQREIRYTLPKNLVGLQDSFIFDSPLNIFDNLTNLQDLFLFDYAKPRQGRHIINKSVLTKEKENALFAFYCALSKGRSIQLDEIPFLLQQFASNEEFIEVMVHSFSAWEVASRLYKEISISGLSFLDFFWSFRAQFMPILNVLRASLPKARVYHAACTGYAGLLGARAAYESGRPLILTEHGIYSRERRIELSRVDWLSSSGESRFLQLERSRNWFREWWVSLFQSLSRTTYDNASKIISLYQGNKDIQVSEGAVADMVDIIPNGIITDMFKDIPRSQKYPGEMLRIGFVGRVVSIKDVKTLLRAMAILATKKVSFQTHIIGPMDEEPEYTEECLDLLEKLHLQDKVFFTGPRRDVKNVYAEMDVLLLTSASEGFPYVILEANCAGVPVVATDVGACRDILTGMGKDDIALGPSGLITAVGMPEETAAELVRFAQSPKMLYAYGQAGRARAVRYYDIKNIMNKYRDLYATYMFAAKKTSHAHGARARQDTYKHLQGAF